MTQQDKPKRGKPKNALDKAQGPQTDVETGRIAKILARAGVASRRDAERMVNDGRVKVNGKRLESPAIVVSLADRIEVDGEEIAGIERTRMWVYHKPAGLVTTNRDPEGRQTVFEALPQHLPRVLTIGRLDINTEGLLLLTNDGGLARILELPRTGWLRRYRVRAYGDIDQARLDALKDGIAVDGVLYGAIEATLDRKQGHNVWITMGLREGKNREIKTVLGALGLDVNRLIRTSFGPFQLGDIGEGDVVEIRSRTLREQLGQRLIEESGANFDASLNPAAPDQQPKPKPSANPATREWISSAETNERARARLDTKPARGPDRGKDRSSNRNPDSRKDPGKVRGEHKAFGGKAEGARGNGSQDKRTDKRQDKHPEKRQEKRPDKRPDKRNEKPGGKQASGGFVQRNRASNVWMAPGARPVAEARKPEVGKSETGKSETGKSETGRDRKKTARSRADVDPRAETRRGSFPKSRAKPRPEAASQSVEAGSPKAQAPSRGKVLAKGPGAKPVRTRKVGKPTSRKGRGPDADRRR